MELLTQHLYWFLQEDTDGTLFNLLDFFPSEDCFSMLGGPFMKEILGDRNVVADVTGKRGSLQKAIADLLSDNPNTFYLSRNDARSARNDGRPAAATTGRLVGRASHDQAEVPGPVCQH